MKATLVMRSLAGARTDGIGVAEVPIRVRIFPCAFFVEPLPGKAPPRRAEGTTVHASIFTRISRDRHSLLTSLRIISLDQSVVSAASGCQISALMWGGDTAMQTSERLRGGIHGEQLGGVPIVPDGTGLVAGLKSPDITFALTGSREALEL